MSIQAQCDIVQFTLPLESKYLCSEDPNLHLLDYTDPNTGTFEGAAIIDNIFYPSIATDGFNLFTYTVVLTSGDICVLTDSVKVDVLSVKAEITGLQESYCFNDAPFIIESNHPDGAFYLDGIYITNEELDPSTLFEGEHILRLGILDDQGCVSNDTVYFMITGSEQAFAFDFQSTICIESIDTIEYKGTIDPANINWTIEGVKKISKDILDLEGELE